jgi:hypothetical protein
MRDDPVYIAEQLGHTDPAFTFRVYQKAAKRRERLSGSYLEAFDQALQWADLGRIGTVAAGGWGDSAAGKAESPLDQAIIDGQRAGSSAVRAADS